MEATGHVLIVEDDAVLRRSIARYLADRGHAVSEAGTIAEARARLRAGRFDAAVLDVGLPDGSGLDLLSMTEAARSLVISGLPDPIRFERSGVRHHLPKPLDLPRVADWVQTLCAI